MEQQPITQKTAPDNLKIGDKILYNGKVYKMDGTGRRFICGTDTQDKNSGVIILKNGATLDLYVDKCTRKTAPKITRATVADIEREINAIADKWGHLDWPEQEKKFITIYYLMGCLHIWTQSVKVLCLYMGQNTRTTNKKTGACSMWDNCPDFTLADCIY